MNKKILLVLSLAVILTASGCGRVKNQEYIDELKKSGADPAQIEELIKYEKSNASLPEGGYADTTGRTVEEAAKAMGMTLEEYIEENELPENLPALVSENEANYTIPVSRMAERYGMSFEEFTNILNMPESVTEDTTWGEALDEVTIGSYIGEGNVQSFVEKYNLPDSVTADTKWGEVRAAVDNAKKEERQKEESQTKDGD